MSLKLTGPTRDTARVVHCIHTHIEVTASNSNNLPRCVAAHLSRIRTADSYSGVESDRQLIQQIKQ